MNNKHTEIERKFLTPNLSFGLTHFPLCNITQMYLSTSPTIRIRKSNDRYSLTVKGKGSMSREEFELDITKYEYEHLSTKADTPPLRKTRYYVDLGNNLTAEIDIYEGLCEGLITTEVEFSSVEQAQNFVPPLWMGEEITYDTRYKNTMLSKYGIPDR